MGDKVNIKRTVIMILVLLVTPPAIAVEDKIELDTIKIMANEELPGVLYLVPWKDAEASPLGSQQLKLDDFFGDLYEPIMPDDAVSKEL